MTYILQKSYLKTKKFLVQELYEDNTVGRKINFGSAGMSDYTIHHDYDRMIRYEKRHRNNENWTKSGINSAGFWSKWILWNLPSLKESIKDTEKRFNIKIIYIRSRSRSRSRSPIKKSRLSYRI